jgi:hypothetical protein
VLRSLHVDDGYHAMITEPEAARGNNTERARGRRPPCAPPRLVSRQLANLGLVVLVVLAVGTAGCNAVPTPSRDINQGQMMLDLTEALNAIRDQSASLQDQVDSLRDVIVRQDTVIRQLALSAGIPMPVSK